MLLTRRYIYRFVHLSYTAHNLTGGQMFYVQHLRTLVPPTTCYELHLW